MPARRIAPDRLLAAVNAQRLALGQDAWQAPPGTGPPDPRALGRACAEAVLCALDAGTDPQPAALRAAVTYLLDLLCSAAPGRAVEVRVPPYAAVQCIGGPRHSRGTPGNVVEMDAVTWVRMATGRLSWAQAAGDGLLAASGPRADLAEYLPLPLGHLGGAR
jgi:hypothetical protein